MMNVSLLCKVSILTGTLSKSLNFPAGLGLGLKVVKGVTRSKNGLGRFWYLNSVGLHYQVWELVDLPPNVKTVGSKWLFKKKTDIDGAVHTYKACLVVKGFTQTYGVDYEETFSPVADIKAIRILIAITAYYDYEIWQMNVKTAFLNGHLS
ncbi:retrotransposon protein, putative, ty1-copia subclass [Tanacetum coccineum]